MDHRAVRRWIQPFFASHPLLFESWWTLKIEPHLENIHVTGEAFDACRCWIMRQWIDDHLSLQHDDTHHDEPEWITRLKSIDLSSSLPSLDAVVHCPKCNNHTTIEQQVRDTRSADEGATVHFLCRSCQHPWTMR